jgi:hypothetical protein
MPATPPVQQKEEKRKTCSVDSQIHLAPDLLTQEQVVKPLDATYPNYKKRKSGSSMNTKAVHVAANSIQVIALRTVK